MSLYSRIRFCWAYTPHFHYPFICSWTCRLFPFPCCCDESRNQCGHAVIYGRIQSPWGYAPECYSCLTWQFYAEILVSHHHDSHNGCISLHSLSPHPCQHFLSHFLWWPFWWVRWYLNIDILFTSLITGDVEHILKFLLAVYVSSLGGIIH